MPLRNVRQSEQQNEEREGDVGRRIDDYQPGGGGGGTRSPLGVPADYKTMVEARTGANWRYPYLLSRPAVPGAAYRGREQGPRYFEGDEWKPASRGPDSIIELQRALVMAGYLGADSKFRLGAWDGSTREAYRQLLEDANASGLDDGAQLRQRALSIEAGGPGSESGWMVDPETGQIVPVPEEQFQAPALNVRTTNKDDLRRVFRSAVTGMLGQGWTEAEIGELVDAYNWKELQVQVGAYNEMVERERELFETGTTDRNIISQVDAPSPDAFIEEQARERDPAGFAATQLAEDFAPSFFAALGGYT